MKARMASGRERASAIGALAASWGDPIIVRGRDWRFEACLILVAGPALGVAAVTFAEWPVAELVAIEAFAHRRGIGSALMAGVIDACKGCRTLRLATTNDNLSAIRFYERRGFRLTAVRPGAVMGARAKALDPSDRRKRHRDPRRDRPGAGAFRLNRRAAQIGRAHV